jgi:hypothetical protein
MSARVYEGEVARWFERGNANGYGFLECEAGSRTDRVYFDASSIVADNIGRRGNCKIQGALVRFQLGRHLHRGQPAAKAIDVRSIFKTDIPEPETHREVSVVDHILKGTREPIAAVFLKRECGDKLYLSCDGVVREFRDRWKTLQVASRVYHGVAAPTERQKTWQAVAAEIFAPGE